MLHQKLSEIRMANILGRASTELKASQLIQYMRRSISVFAIRVQVGCNEFGRDYVTWERAPEAATGCGMAKSQDERVRHDLRAHWKQV